MKASNAVNILRAARARMEDWGALQVGRLELVALEFARTKMQDTTGVIALMQMAVASHTASVKMGSPAMVMATEQFYQAIRSAYKTLEQVDPNEEFMFELKKVTKTTETVAGSDWAKDLGLSEKEILDALKQPPKDSN